MTTVLFYSFKGGVGRSLTLCNAAINLSRAGKRVGLIDFDAEAPSLNIYFREALSGFDVLTHNVDILRLLLTEENNIGIQEIEAATRELSVPDGCGPCFLIPCAGRSQDLDEIDRRSRWLEVPRLLERIIDLFRQRFDLDHVLIDTRSGWSLPALVVLNAADVAVVATRADTVSVEGNKKILSAIDKQDMEAVMVITAVPANITDRDNRLTAFVENFGFEEDAGVVVIPYESNWYFDAKARWDDGMSDRTRAAIAELAGRLEKIEQ